MKNILVTGGCGFIGSNFIHYLFNQNDFKGNVINIDKLTYAGNINNLTHIQELYGDFRYTFIHGDILDYNLIYNTVIKHDIDTIVHFAAESHVDRSINGASQFLSTNILGTHTLLDVCKNIKDDKNKNIRFHLISTDEVFGSSSVKSFKESDAYHPGNPYSASKASADMLAMAYINTYKLNITVSNCTNNYGPYQFPEKFIPIVILALLNKEPIPVYGDGKYIRDWLYVVDHCDAIYKILKHGVKYHFYNISSLTEVNNITLINLLANTLSLLLQNNEYKLKYKIKRIKDRPGHDRRYSLDSSKIMKELNWKPNHSIEKGLIKTVQWYLDNSEWIANIQNDDYKKWIDYNYTNR